MGHFWQPDGRLGAMSKFSFCYHTVPLKKGKPMEGFQEKKQNENLRYQEFCSRFEKPCQAKERETKRPGE